MSFDMSALSRDELSLLHIIACAHETKAPRLCAWLSDVVCDEQKRRERGRVDEPWPLSLDFGSWQTIEIASATGLVFTLFSLTRQYEAMTHLLGLVGVALAGVLVRRAGAAA